MKSKGFPLIFSLITFFVPIIGSVQTSSAQTNSIQNSPAQSSSTQNSPTPRNATESKPLARPAQPLKPDEILTSEMPCSLRFGSYGEHNYCRISVNKAGIALQIQANQSASAESAENQMRQRRSAVSPQRFLIPATNVLGIYSRPLQIAQTDGAEIGMEIDFLMNDADSRTGNFSNSLKLNTSPEFETAFRQRLSPTLDSLPRFRLTARQFGDRTAQRQQLLDTKTCVRCDLSGVDLAGADLAGANLEGASLEGADLTGVNLSGAYLVGADFNNANLASADLSYAKLTFASFQATNLRRTKLNAAALQNTLFQNANLSNAQMQGADLNQANLERAILEGSDLSAYQPNETLSISTTSSPSSTTNYYTTTLRNANLRNANLRGIDLRDAILDRTNLSGADLTGARLTTIDAKAANFCNTTLPDGSISRQGC
jgi:uncharacterized protein YjbI with pentapeptide repeats